MVAYLIQLLFSIMPESRLYNLKSILLRLRGYKIGENVKIVSSVKFRIKHLTIGDNSFVGHDTLIAGGDSTISIGKNVDIGPRCVIVSGTHDIGTAIRRAGGGKSLNIRIGNGTWIGASSTILGGVSVGNGCIVAAGSIVIRDIPSNVMVAGVPAKFVRNLDGT